MAKTFDRNEPVVVVIGSGAGGGTLFNTNPLEPGLTVDARFAGSEECPLAHHHGPTTIANGRSASARRACRTAGAR